MPVVGSTVVVHRGKEWPLRAVELFAIRRPPRPGDKAGLVTEAPCELGDELELRAVVP
jgi:hypothetical protein